MIAISAGWRRQLVTAALVAAVGGMGVVWGAESSSDKTAGVGGMGNVSPDAKGLEEKAKGEWARISVQINAETDLETIVGMHGRFLDQYADSALAEKVRASQEVYEALVKSKGVKFRGKWVAAEQVDVMQKQWREAIGPALELYQAGKFKEALEAAKKVSAADRENGEALAVAGLSQYRLHFLPAARGYFEKLAALEPGNVLAENNLAVVGFELKEPVVGLMHYGKALSGGANNVMLLDNVAEALHAYLGGGGDKNNAVFKDVSKKAAAAEGEVVPVMLEKGLVRRGAMWATQAQQEQILKDVSSIKYQMQVLDKQYADYQKQLAAAQQGLKQANAEFQDASNAMSRIDAQMRNAAASGTPAGVGVAKLQSSIQDRSWEQERMTQAAQQQEDCQRQIEALSTGGEEFKKAAAKLTVQMSTVDQKYTGVQRVMEPEGTREGPAIANAMGPTMVTVAAASAVGPAGKDVGNGEGVVAGLAQAGPLGGDIYGVVPTPAEAPWVYSPPPPLRMDGYGGLPAYGPELPGGSGPEEPFPGYMPRNVPLPMTSQQYDLVYVPVQPPKQYQPLRREGIPQQPGVAGPWAMTMGLQTGQPLNAPPQIGYQTMPAPTGAMPLVPSGNQPPYLTVLVPHVEGSGRPTVTVPIQQPLTPPATLGGHK